MENPVIVDIARAKLEQGSLHKISLAREIIKEYEDNKEFWSKSPASMASVAEAEAYLDNLTRN